LKTGNCAYDDDEVDAV
jgi:hypothetical protein